MDNILAVDDLAVRPIAENELESTLEVYRQCEDFLALGPTPSASMAMVVADIEHSSKDGGVYCGIWRGTNQIGILDFIPESEENTAVLSLLMVAKRFRHQGIGSAVLEALVAYLRAAYGSSNLGGGVQINNPSAITFWRRHGFEIGAEARDCGDGTTAYPMIRRIDGA